MRMKKGLCALMISLPLLLCACGVLNGGNDEEEGKKDGAQLLQEEYQSLAGCDMTARVRCDWDGEVTDYTLRCVWNAGGTSSVEVLEPELLRGVRAEFDRETLTLVYDGVSLPAGTLSAEELSPAQCLPMLMDAIRKGYILEKGAEQIDGQDCARLLFDVTGAGGNKIHDTVWFGTDHIPVHAEVEVDGTVVFTVDFTEFQVQTAAREEGSSGLNAGSV